MSLQVQLDAPVRPDADKDRIEALPDFLKFVAAYGLIAHDGNAHPSDGANLRIENRAGQTEGRNAVAQHAAGLGQGLENGDRITASRQLESAT